MKTQPRLIGLCLFTSILALLLLAIAYFKNRPLTDVSLVKTDRTVMATSAPLSCRYTLSDHRGRLRSESDFFGKYQLIYFGYSFCPDICPMALTAMTQALKRLGEEQEQVVPILITVDPKRDTAEHLALYKENFHPRLVCLTGSQAQIQQAQAAFRVYAQEAKPEATMSEYLIDHSSLIYLLDKQGRLIAFFSHTTPSEHMSAKIKELMGVEKMAQR